MLNTGVWATRPRLHIVRKARMTLVGGSPTFAYCKKSVGDACGRVAHTPSNGGATTHFMNHAFLGIGEGVSLEVGT